MNVKLLVSGFIFSFLLVLLGGCTEVEDIIGPGIENQEYIAVTVIAQMCIINDTFQTYLVNEPVDIKIIKDGGERFEGVPSTDANGCTSAHATFNLYNKQSIVAKAYPTYYPYLYQQKTLPWEVVESGSVQKAYTWNVYFAFVV